MIDIKSQIINPALELEDIRAVASAEGWELADIQSLGFFVKRNFRYRRTVTITEQSGSNLTNYQVLIELSSTNFDFGHAQTNGEDIRFTDASGNLLSYWIEDWDAVSESAKVWIKVPSIPANSSTVIYMYYGNSSVSDESDGDATFEFFDDFEEQQQTLDYFASNGLATPMVGIITPSATYYNNKTFIVWQGANLDPYAIEYNHSTQTWSSKYQVGDNPLSGDSHGAPSILRDSSGYLHVFYGCHGTTGCSGDACYIQHAKSANPDDISSWIDKGNICGQYATYPNPVLVGSDIYLFYRNLSAGYGKIVYCKSTDNGESWNSENTVVDLNGDGTYLGKVEVEGTSKIHLSWAIYDNNVNKRLHAYHAYLDLSDLHMYSMDGTDLGTTVDKSEADAHCKVFDSGSSQTNIVRVHLDGSGTPYIIFLHDDGGWKYKFTKWNGSSWDSPITITSTGSQFNSFDFIVHSSSNIELYLTKSDSERGGDIEKWSWDGTSWSKVATVFSKSTYGKSLNYPHIVFSYNSELKIVFSEEKVGDYTTSLKLFAYGDSGIVQAVVTDELNTNKWTNNGATVNISDSILELNGPSDGLVNIITKNASFKVNQILRFRTKFGSLDYSKWVGGQTINGTSSNTSKQTKVVSRAIWGVTKLISGDNNTNSEIIDLDADYASDYYIYEISRYSTGVKVFVDDSLKATASTYYTDADEYVHICHYDADLPSYTDWILVRKYASPEPSVSIGSENTV